MVALSEILESFRTGGKRPAVVYRSGVRRFSYSYAQLYDYACRMASYLESEGIVPGDRVLLWGPNSHSWAFAFWGMVARGAVVVPVDFMSGADRAKSIAEHAGVSFVVQSRAKQEKLVGLPSIMLEDVESLLSNINACDSIFGSSPEEICEIVYTSGTTGDPKGVVLTHANLTANLRQVLALFPLLNENYTFLSLLPLSHMFEQMAGFLAPLSLGGSVVYLRTLKPSAIMDAFAEEDIYAMVAVPRLLQLLRGSVEQKFGSIGAAGLLRTLLSIAPALPIHVRRLLFFPVHRRFGRNFRLVVSGGAPLGAELFHFWDSAGFTMVEGYGLTETSPVLTANSMERQVPGSVGWPLPGVELKLPYGEVLARGPNVFKGYYRNEEATKCAFTDDGWFRTGDLGELDESGALVIRGRSKDLIVTGGGVNVYPEEVEAFFAGVAGVKEVTVLGIDRGSGEEVHAVIVPDGSGRAIGDIANEVNNSLDESQRITGFSLWPEQELPKTTTLKVRRFVVKDRLMRAREGSSTALPVADRLVMIISGLLGCNPAEVTENAFLVADLGLTSIARLELVNILEREFRTDLDETAIGPRTRIADLRDMIASRGGIHSRKGLRLWTATLPVRWIRRFFDLLLHRPLVGLFVSLEARGVANLASLERPVLFIANHTSYLDQPAVMFSLPPALRYRCATAAWAEFFFVNFKNVFQHAWKRSAFEYCSLALGVFPLPQASGFRPALQHMGRLVERGESILVFPEGARSADGRMLPFQRGLAVMVGELSVPVVPVGIKGLEHVLPRGAWRPRRGKVIVTFGKPLNFSGESPGDIVGAAENGVRSLLD